MEDIYRQYHRPEFLVIDPLVVVREYNGKSDQEWVALVSALCAFGGVRQIILSVRQLLQRMNHADPRLTLQGFKHRIYVGEDFVLLHSLYRQSCEQFGSLKNHFLSYHAVDNETIENALEQVIQDWKRWSEESALPRGKQFLHMLNAPSSGSTCKRWLMFLKWMIRSDDGIDVGLWSGGALRSSQLLIPLDTHLFRITKKLRLTRRKSANWDAALEVTRALKKIDSEDPTRFDFSLCRSGMLQSTPTLHHMVRDSTSLISIK